MTKYVIPAMELAGGALIAGALALIYLPAGIAAAGVILILAAYGLERRAAKR